MATIREKIKKVDFQDEGKTLKVLISISIVIHIFFLVVKMDGFFSKSPPIIEEWVIEAELMPDFNMDGSTEAALPNAAKADEILVEKQILPQLPKKFVLEEEIAPSKEEMAIEKASDLKKEKIVKKEKPKKKETVISREQKDANKLKKKDALARLLKETARRDKKFAEKTSAPLSKKLAQRKSELAKKDDGFSGGGGMSAIRMNKYRKLLYRAIRRNYSLPSAYNLRNAEIVAKVGIILNAKGDIRKIDLYESSGDQAYDSLVMKAVKDSVPLPKPPKEQAGKKMIIVFSPKIF